jgi:hypothetical protein
MMNYIKKMTLTLILTLLAGFGVFAQTYVVMVRPVGVKEWGYANLKGDMIIDAKFKKCTGFSEEGYAAIYDAKLKEFYFINIKGDILGTQIKDFKLMEVFGFGMKGFSDGFAAVKYNEKWGYLNTAGQLVIPAKYDKVTRFNEGFASVQLGDKYFIVDKTGKEIPVNVPNMMDLNAFSGQLASYKSADGNIGFVDGSGNIAIRAQYQSAGDFYGGIAWAKNSAGSVGYVDTKGEWVVKPEFTAGKDFDPVSGLARVKSGESWKYVNKKGEFIVAQDSEAIEDFSDGLARGKKAEKYGFVNIIGDWAIQPQFDGARDFKNGYACVKSGEKWGIIDKTGKWVVEPKFEETRDVELVK